MKRLLPALVLVSLSWLTRAQSTATIGIQFYVDANNNCSYDLGETLVYNVPATFAYINSQGNTVNSTLSYCVSTCSTYTNYVWSPSVTPLNTVTINQNSGILPNTACGGFNNLPYNSNTTNYLPIVVNTTANVASQVNYVNYYTATGTTTYAPSTGTISVCSNLGSDSIAIGMTIGSLYNCAPTAQSPRTYSLFLDGVNYDQVTCSGSFNNSTNASGVNSMLGMWEYYSASMTWLTFYFQLPTTFSVLGTHTFELRSSMIYNDPLSQVNYSLVINSIPCNKISGRFYNDCNNNCTFDTGDSYGVGSLATGLIYNTSTGFNLNFYPAWDGKFSIYLPTATAYSLTQFPTYTVSPYNFTACTTGTATIPAGAATNTFMFGYQSSSPNLTDPDVYLFRLASTSTLVSPGVGATMGVYVGSQWWNPCGGAVINPGRVKVTLPKFVNYQNMVSGPAPTVITTAALLDTLVWTMPNFSNTVGPWCSFSVVVSPTAVPNTTFTIGSFIYPTIDNSLLNNSSYWTRTIGGPFDPNDKTTQVTGLMANGDVPFGADRFFYTIRFQNIGNAPAINVKTLDTLDVNFDLNTLKVTQSSFPVSMQIDNNSRLVGFFFNGINLPGVTQNEPGSHGFVTYTVKLKPGVPVNTVLKNRAHNYFDYNAPVATNQTSNKLVLVAGIERQPGNSSLVTAVPNPFNSALKITAEKTISACKVYNLMGAQLMESLSTSNEVTLDLDHLPAAIYLIKVTDVAGQVTTIKVIKQ